MKKIVLFLISILMLASCTDKVLIDYDYGKAHNVNKEIAFGTNFKMPNATKAIITNIDSLQKYEYGVFAKLKDNASHITVNPANNGFFIYDDTLLWNSSAWVLKNNKHYYWPKAQVKGNAGPTLNFYSYGPVGIDANGINVTDGVITIDVNPKEKDLSINDLVYASALNQTDSLDGANKKGTGTYPDVHYVRFSYAHQLAWIVFEAKCSELYDSLGIDSIKVVVDNSTATFVINTTDATVDGVAAYSALLKNAATPVAFTHKLDTKVLNNTYQVVGGFVALPQNVNASTMKATIYYTGKIGGDRFKDMQVTVKLHDGNLHEDGTATAPWTVANWSAGNKYVYRIHIIPNEILFTATVSDWAIAANSPYLIY